MVVWFLYAVLLTLNFLDYATTHALLTHFKGKVQWGDLPLWKNTRFGKWCVRRGLTRPSVRGKVHWYDHEINGMARKLLKKYDILGLAVLKGVAMGIVAASVGLNSILQTYWGWAFLLFMIDLYILVVANNLGVMKRCRLAPFVK